MPRKRARKSDPSFRVGFGYDIHRLVKGRTLFLGGVQIDHPKGLRGHSDADVVLHAICDALLGAVAMGDIGEHFPDTDQRFLGAASEMLLKKVFAMVRSKGYGVCNVDVTILAEEPKISPYKRAMGLCIARALTIDVDAVNIKATTQEGLGFAGKGIAAHAVVLLKR